MSEQNVNSLVLDVCNDEKSVELESPPSWSTPMVTVMNVADLTNAGVGCGADCLGAASS